MTDNPFPREGRTVPRRSVDLLTEALRIDDQRSNYCEQLEFRICEQTAEIEELRSMLGQYLMGLFEQEREP